jgi:hypothetical protein
MAASQPPKPSKQPAVDIPPSVEATERERLSRAIADAQRTLFDLALETEKRRAEADEAETESATMRQYLNNVTRKMPAATAAAHSSSHSALQAAAAVVARAIAPPDAPT